MNKRQRPLLGKKILLGISGGIAAYKCAELTRRLIEQGAEIRVVMTACAKEFITPLTMQTVSGHVISDSLFTPQAAASIEHIELVKWANLLLIAPATANIIAKLSNGIADDLLSTLCLATQGPIAISPAMNVQMYQAAATQNNLSIIAERDVFIWGPAEGMQACGDVGLGRMLEPDALVDLCINFFASDAKILSSVSITITAGPTQEALDPVRYISNHSSGKMGYAIAVCAQKMGANITLISGPVNLSPPKNVKLIKVLSAKEMHCASLASLKECDIFIACAAVADYKPARFASQKMKKQQGIDDLMIKLVKNPDIIASIASVEPPPFCVGFAAETQDVKEHALKKLKAKKLDLIAANNVSITDQGFNSDQNALTVYSKSRQFDIPFADKKEVAVQLLTIISKHFTAKE
ncbi:MAG: bifunctional phosphopantothenoylcysteine decarboxylase/phosphopantothenate--cysteine ligase CoaBC [Psychromonas sp.]|nr:bifunctional phosphopantothenoylcysteine decarboxylase/phosphopantothenate--cysteine ligase CoaBC [Psychromonas sp.]